MDRGFDAYNAERLRAANTTLLGRNTYELFKGIWPAVAGDPGRTPVSLLRAARLHEFVEQLLDRGRRGGTR